MAWTNHQDWWPGVLSTGADGSSSDCEASWLPAAGEGEALPDICYVSIQLFIDQNCSSDQKGKPSVYAPQNQVQVTLHLRVLDELVFARWPGLAIPVCACSCDPLSPLLTAGE